MEQNEEDVVIDPVLMTSMDLRLRMIHESLQKNQEYHNELMEKGSLKIGTLDCLNPGNKNLKMILSITYE